MKKKHSLNLDQERYHTENLINNRFNFLLIIFSATIASLATNSSMFVKLIIFIISLVICFLITLTIARAQLKYNEYFEQTKNDENHPVKLNDDKINRTKYFLINKSKKNIIGFYIPLIIVGILLIAVVFIVLDLFFGIKIIKFITETNNVFGN
jgi:membrane protein YdbS with pleckstrin-like domain